MIPRDLAYRCSPALLSLFALALCLTPLIAEAGRLTEERYKSFVHSNERLVRQKQFEFRQIANFLKTHDIPVHSYESLHDTLKIETVVLQDRPTCYGSKGPYGPVVLLRTGKSFPRNAVQVYVIGSVDGDVFFDGVSAIDSPSVNGNLFAGVLRAKDEFCYAITTISLWARKSLPFITPTTVTRANTTHAMIVYARDFKGKPKVLARFQQMFRHLTLAE